MRNGKKKAAVPRWDSWVGTLTTEAEDGRPIGESSVNQPQNLGVSLVVRDAARRIERTLPEAYKLHHELSSDQVEEEKAKARSKDETIAMLEDIIARLSEENDRRLFQVAQQPGASRLPTALVGSETRARASTQPAASAVPQPQLIEASIEANVARRAVESAVGDLSISVSRGVVNGLDDWVQDAKTDLGSIAHSAATGAAGDVPGAALAPGAGLSGTPEKSRFAFNSVNDLRAPPKNGKRGRGRGQKAAGGQRGGGLPTVSSSSPPGSPEFSLAAAAGITPEGSPAAARGGKGQGKVSPSKRKKGGASPAAAAMLDDAYSRRNGKSPGKPRGARRAAGGSQGMPPPGAPGLGFSNYSPTASYS